MNTRTLFVLTSLLTASAIFAQLPTYTLFPGWNMIGGGGEPFSAEYFDTLDAVYPPVFTYNNLTRVYDTVVTISPLVGYWVLANDTVVIGSDDCDCPPTVTDIDGNVYRTVLIGDQCWMAENLKATHYRDGTEIMHAESDSLWQYSVTGAYCLYDNNPANLEIYGCLYNGFAVVDSQGIAPEGWHVPSDEEWKTLEISLEMDPAEADSLGGRGVSERGLGVGARMAGGYDLWYEGDLRDNPVYGVSGFDALPAGYRYIWGTFLSISFNSYFWTSTSTDVYALMYRLIGFNYIGVYRDHASFVHGFQVRCVKD